MPREKKSREPGCCGSFWGPFRPLIGGHSLEEAATSAWLPTPVVAVWRLAVAAFLLTVYIKYTITGDYEIKFFSVLMVIIPGAVFLFAAFASIVYSVSSKVQATLLASFIVFWFQSSVSGSILATIIYWTLIYEQGRSIELLILVPHGINVAVCLLDMFISLKMQFRLFYVFMGMVISLPYIAFLWIYYAITNEFFYEFLDFRDGSLAATIGILVGIVLFVGVIGIFMLLINRINRCVTKKDDEKVVDAQGEEWNV